MWLLGQAWWETSVRLLCIGCSGECSAFSCGSGRSEQPSTCSAVTVDPQLFLPPFIRRHFGGFHVLAVVGDGVQIPLEIVTSLPFPVCPEAGLLGHSSSVFNFLSNYFFRNGSTSYISTNSAQHSLFSHPCTHFFTLKKKKISVLTEVLWCLTVVFLSILMTAVNSYPHLAASIVTSVCAECIGKR